MEKNKEYFDILNECLDFIALGGDVPSCLSKYPRHAAELKPLLETAYKIKSAAAIRPGAEFRQRASADFQKAVRDLPRQQPRAFRWKLSWALPLALVAIIVMGGGGTVLAANNALPDSPLYNVKRAVESVQMAFTFTDTGKEKLYSEFTGRRVTEVIKMAEKGNVEMVLATNSIMNDQMVSLSNLNVKNSNFKASYALTTSGYSTDSSAAGTRAPAATIPPTATTVSPATTPAATTDITPVTPTIAVPAPVVVIPGFGDNDQSVGTSENNLGQDDYGSRNDGSQNNQDKFQLALIKKLEKYLKDLREQLEKASPELKPALEETIAIVQRALDEAVAALGQ
jgi:hypothetical protein